MVRRAPGKITTFLHIVHLLIKPTNHRDSNNPFNEPSNNEDLERATSGLLKICLNNTKKILRIGWLGLALVHLLAMDQTLE